MSVVSLAVVFLGIFLGVAWVAGCPLLLLGRWASRQPGPRRLLTARWNALVLLGPPLAGLVVALGAVWPAGGAAPGWHCHCGQHSLPFHLCLVHPQVSLSLFPYAAVVVLLLGRGPLRALRALRRRLGQGRALLGGQMWQRLVTPHGPLLIGELGQPNAFTLGLLRPTVIVDRAWWRSLGSEERAMVAAHEAEHAARRDPLAHAAVLLLASFVSFRLSQPLVAGWLEFAEHRADRSAAAAAGGPLAVAEFLVRAFRRGEEPALMPAFCGGVLEVRVLSLLELASRPLPRTPDVRASVGLGLAGAAALAITLGYPIHLFVEKLLSLFR